MKVGAFQQGEHKVIFNLHTIARFRLQMVSEVDPMRGPLMAWAFERYAVGDINLRDLLTELTDKGLDTTPGPQTPSKPLRLAHFHRLLTHPYYKGLVRYKGITYPGNHEPLVSESTWDNVQDALETRGRSGEKVRKHPHYLKGTIFCGECGSRLIVSNNRGRRGKVYPYFICIGRQRNSASCTQKAVLIETVEELVEQHYGHVQPKQKLLGQLQDMILDEMQIQRNRFAKEHDVEARRKVRLEDEQKKLLGAHYADAVPLNLMKSEQERIARELRNIKKAMAATTMEFTAVEKNLKRAVAYASNWEQAYLAAGSTIRRQMNQSIFQRILVDDHGGVTSEFTEPFELLLSDEVTEAARRTAEVRSGHSGIDQILDDVVKDWSGEQGVNGLDPRNNKTPTLARGGLSFGILVEVGAGLVGAGLQIWSGSGSGVVRSSGLVGEWGFDFLYCSIYYRTIFLKVDFGSSQSIHEQLAGQLRTSIARGDLAAGERLSPAREIAGSLGVNVHTLLRAFKILREEGLLEVRRGRGTIVTSQTPCQVKLVERVRELVAEAHPPVLQTRKFGKFWRWNDESRVLEIFAPRHNGATCPPAFRYWLACRHPCSYLCSVSHCSVRSS